MKRILNEDSLEIRKVAFPSEGATLRGLLFLPPGRTKRVPIVIMAHGTSATIRMVADRYAEVFTRAGLAVLLYDHRNFGISDGEPRQEINPWIQSRGYRDAIDFAVSLSEVDSGRIAIWGDSYSGGEAMVMGAIDNRVKAIVVQCPICGEKPPGMEPSAESFQQLEDILLRGNVQGNAEDTTGPMPVVSFDQSGTPSLLKPIQAFRWFIDYGGRAGTLWVNRVTRVIPKTVVPFSPVLSAPFVKAPILMVVAPRDEMTHARLRWRNVGHGIGVGLV